MCVCVSVCLIKVGGLGPWRPNLCLNGASSLWPWELLCWTEWYLFGHLIHTHKWPLGAVFDKQSDWIAWVNVCGFSPVLSSRPLRISPVLPQGHGIWPRIHTAHVFVWTYIAYITLYTNTCTYVLHLLTQSQSLVTHQSCKEWLRLQNVRWANSNHTEGIEYCYLHTAPTVTPQQ